MTEPREIVYHDGQRGTKGDFPVAIICTQKTNVHGDTIENEIVDPIFDSSVTRNLYGRIMTLVEATTEPSRLKAVKDIFSKELLSWENDVHQSARDIALMGATADNNIYLR